MTSSNTVDARASVAWVRRLVHTTPGVIGATAIAIAALCVIAGVVCATQLQNRIVEHDEVLDRSEPFAYAAQDLYAALSAADAAAASAFLTRHRNARRAGALSTSARRLGGGIDGRDRRRHRSDHPEGGRGHHGTADRIRRHGRDGTGEQPPGIGGGIGVPPRGVSADADEDAAKRRRDPHRGTRGRR